MPGVLAKINALHRGFSRAEKRTADFVLANPEEVPFQSVYQVSRSAGVSVATVSRFVRKIGYGTFRDFKVELALDSTAPIQDIYQPITPDDSDEDVVDKVFLGNIQSLADTRKLLDVSHLIKTSKQICAASRLVFFGIGGSGNVAREAALRFSLIDIQAEAYGDAYQILIQALRVDKKAVALGISHSGQSTLTVEALKLARKNGAVTVGISNYPRSPLRAVSTTFFCTSFPESRVRVAALSARLAQLCLIDALYLLAARHKKGLWNAERLNTITEPLLRLPETR